MSLWWILFLWVIGLAQSYGEEEIVPIDCRCSENIDSCRKNGTCESEFGFCYWSALVEENKILSHENGCIGAHIVRHMCFSDGHQTNDMIVRCCNTTLCNKDMDSFLKRVEKEINVGYTAPPSPENSNILMLIIGAAGTLLFVILAFGIYKTFSSRTIKKLLGYEKDPYVTVAKEPQYTNHILDEISLSNTSGAGRTQFVQRTISKQAQLIELVGKGRYGEVWKALWRGDPVAIKQFDPRDEQSWIQEVKMYETSWLRHENILGHMGSDCKSTASSTRWWIMMEFCQHGSLYEYLSHARYTPIQLLESVRGIYSGLEHLHSAIFGNNPNNSKPGIAHRDLKTHNILVKNPTQCCIGDLGLAITSNDYKEKVNKTNFQVGTRRYMAPEILDSSLNFEKFFTFKAADMFSSSYIIWEMLHVCQVDSDVTERERTLPYIDEVPGNPAVEDMLKVVVEEGKRPPLLDRWRQNPITRVLCNMIQELWCKDPSERLSALRIKKTLSEMLLHKQDSFPPV
uniref:receptor protein serine/threonine kinase n=1 Tax=Mnemiopsis leidyi TaxID=27923 RepID=G5CTM2_MNELE|nr:TGF-beta type I receptor [Mnemiopsis leidyi]